MDLHELTFFLRRRWHLILVPTLVALVVASYLGWRGYGAYKLTARLSVSVYPEPESGRYFPGDYYAWVSSEYLADDLSEILKSRRFVEDLSASMGRPVESSLPKEIIRTRKTHRIIEVDILGADYGELVAIGEHMTKVLNEKLPTYLAQLNSRNAVVNVIDPPRVVRANTVPLMALDVALKTALGLVLGIGLAFLVHYTDQTIYSRKDLEELGFAVIAEIPEYRDGLAPGRVSSVRVLAKRG